MLWTTAFSFTFFKLTHWLGWLRVSESVEETGLDTEDAYHIPLTATAAGYKTYEKLN